MSVYSIIIFTLCGISIILGILGVVLSVKSMRANKKLLNDLNKQVRALYESIKR